MSASDFAPLREPPPEQIIDTLREVRWSVVMDCLHHEQLTPHGRWVLENAPDAIARLLREHAERGALLDNCRVALRSIGPEYHLVSASADRAAKRGHQTTADALDHVYGRVFWLDHALGTLTERVDAEHAARKLPLSTPPTEQDDGN